MKKIISAILIFTFVFLCACSKDALSESTTANQNNGADASDTTLPPEVTTVASLEAEEIDPARVYVVYFSHESDPMDSVAKYISDSTKGGIHRVETTVEYPTDEAELVKKAAAEYNNNARPPLMNAPTDMFSYDIVFLCFPAWSNTMPMALWTFIEDYDMRDKAVIPVCFGSDTALNNAIRDINTLKPDMTVVDGFAFNSDFVSDLPEFNIWLNKALYGEGS